MILAKAFGGNILWKEWDFSSSSDWQKFEADVVISTHIDANCTQKENAFAELGIKLFCYMIS